jgi:nucleoside-diphosphate-sugar epimerase
MGYELKKKVVLVTGATGFIGSRVAMELVKKGARVRALARHPARARDLGSAGVSVVAGDMTDPGALAGAVRDCQTIFHFAGTTNAFKPRSYFERVNVDGTRLLAEAALRERVERFIHISTVWVYGLRSGPGICETSAYQESGQSYSDTKLEAERAVRRLIDERGLPAVILQPSEVYGPGDPNWTERPLDLIKSGRLVLADGGRGLLQPVFIDDLVQAVLAAAENGGLGETYILCGPDVVTVREYFLHLARMLGKEHLPSLPGWLALGTAGVAEWVARISRRAPVFTRQEVLSTMATATYDGRKAERELGFAAKTTLAEGMAEVESWLRATQGNVPWPAVKKDTAT